MQHPVFLNKKSVSVYFGLWALIMGVHFSIFYFIYFFPIEVALADSLIFNGLFCLAGISMWYIVRYSIPDQKNSWNVLFNHVAFLTLTLVVWNGLSFTILSTIFSHNKVYMDTLVISIPNKVISGIIFYIVIALIYYLFIYYIKIQEKVNVESRLREVLKETELNMLKSQINPHFLFNSLNSISSLTITNPEKAREMVIKLSDFLRYSVSHNATSFTTLETEMPKLTGLELLDLLEQPPLIIFSTAYDQYAIKAFEMNAVDYLLKPYSKERFTQAVQRALAQGANGIRSAAPVQNLVKTLDENPEFLQRIAVKSRHKVTVVPIDDIIYLEAEGDYCATFSVFGKLKNTKNLVPSTLVRRSLSFLYSSLSRSRMLFNPIPVPLRGWASGSKSLTIFISRYPFLYSQSITMLTCSVLSYTPCLMAFSNKGCSNITGI